MAEVVCTSRHKYAEKNRSVGERYDADEKFISAMVLMGWVKRADRESTGQSEPVFTVVGSGRPKRKMKNNGGRA